MSARQVAATPGALPRAGAVVRIGVRASHQFAGQPGFLFRVIGTSGTDSIEGWTWLDGYQLDASGDAVARRSIFVRLAGLDRSEAAGLR